METLGRGILSFMKWLSLSLEVQNVLSRYEVLTILYMESFSTMSFIQSVFIERGYSAYVHSCNLCN